MARKLLPKCLITPPAAKAPVIANNPTACARFTPNNSGQRLPPTVRTNQHVILIDTGDVPTRNNLVDYLKKQGISVIDKVIITHPHADQLGGIAGVMEHFTVKQIYDSGQTTANGILCFLMLLKYCRYIHLMVIFIVPLYLLLLRWLLMGWMAAGIK
ncbi:MBL fold metallo-hydrolase [bacterium BFN5]|nr:MBL fold metallo-hydrolase [bacterium BFN5]